MGECDLCMAFANAFFSFMWILCNEHVHPNLIMLALHDLFNTPLSENSKITIHSQRFDIFTLSMQTNTNVFDDDESIM
jgi:hypothetical protein